MAELTMLSASGGASTVSLERYCSNHRISFIASLLLCALLALPLWAHVQTAALGSWLALVILTQLGQVWHVRRYLNAQAPLKNAQANWMPGLFLGSLATGASWGGAFFVLGLTSIDPIAMMLIFAVAGVTAYAGIAKAHVLPLALSFEFAALLPLSVWLFMQDGVFPQYMGIIAMLYLALLYFLLRQINAMALSVHSLHTQNTELSEALARVQTLERESAMFRSMFEMIADPAIAVHDPDDDMRIIYANAAACRHFGVDEETVLTLRPADFDVRINAEKRQLMLDRLEQHGRFAFQSVHRRASGEEVPVEVVMNTFEHEGGLLRVTFVRNIAARLAAEQHTRELELAALRQEGDERIGRYLECVPGLFFTLRRDRDGKLSMPFARGSSASFQGLDPAVVADSIAPLLALCHPDDVAPMLDELHASAQEMRPCHIEFRIGDPVEGVMTMALTAQPQASADDAEVMEWHGFMQDISARKHIEHALNRSEQEFRSLAVNLPVAVIRYDEAQRRSYLNPAAERMLHGTLEELLGRLPGDGGVPATAAMVEHYRSKMAEVLASGETCELEFVLDALPLEQQEHYAIRFAPEFDSAGSTNGVLAIWFDITERRRLEEQLKMKGHALDNSSEAMYLIGELGRFVYVNEQASRSLGYSREELLTMGVPDIDPEFSAASLGDRSEKIQQEGGTFIFETRHKRRDGTLIPVEIQMSELAFGGQVFGLALVRDITERKQAEADLQLLRQAINQSSDGMFVQDESLRFVAVNDAACRSLGYSREELSGMTTLDIDPGFTREQLVHIFATAELGKPNSFESSRRTRDGRIFPVEITGTFFEIEGVRHAVSMVRDITERKAIEKALSDSEAMLQEAQRIAHVGSWDVDMVNDRLTWSDEIFRIWEIDKTKFRADFAAFLETVHPEDRARVSQAYNDAVINHTLYEVEHRLLFPDGRVKHILERGEPRYDEQGKPVRFIGTSLDITERKLMEEAMQERGDLLQAIMESSPEIIVFALDQDYRYLSFNDKHRQVMQAIWGKEIAVGMNMLDEVIGGHADRESAKQGFDRALSGEIFVEESAYGDEARSREYWQTFWSPIRSGTGEVTGLTCFVLNISERKRIEIALAARERDFRSLAANMPDNMARFDTEGRYLYVNPAHEHTLGMKAEDLIGQSIPDTHEQVKAGVLQVASSGQAIHAVRQSVMVNGIEELHDVSLVPEFDEHGKVVSVLGMGRDMTERYRMQETIAAREQEFRSLAENISDHIVRWDLEGRYLYINPAHERLLGKTINELSPMPFADSNEPLHAAFRQVIATGLPQQIEQHVTVAGHDEVHSVNLMPEFDADGKLVSVLALGRDMTSYLRMQEAIAAREQEFRSLAESSPDSIIRYDLEGRICYLNDLLLGLLGCSSPDEVLGKRPSEAWPDGRFAAIEQAAAKVVLSKEMVSVELSVPNKAGELSHNLIYVVPEFDAQGDIVGSIAFGRNITSIKQLEADVIAREQEFRSLAENSPDPIYRYDRNCRRIYANQAVERLTGIPREAMLGKSPTEFSPVPSINAVRAQECIQSVLDSGTSAELELSFIAKSGDEVFIHNVFVPEFDASGTVQSVLCLGRDITERKQMELALAERQAFLDSLFEAIPIPVFSKDREGRYLKINRAFEQYYGAMREQMIGKSVFDTHPRELAETYHAKDVEVFERRVELQQYEYQIKHANGTLRDVLFSKAAFADAQGEVQGLIGAVMDITERKQAEVELQRRFDMILELNDKLETNARSLEEQAVELEASQEQLKLTEAWYRGILHSAPDGMMVINERGTITMVNAQLARMFGYAENELIGQVMEVLVPDDMRSSHAELREGFVRDMRVGRDSGLAGNLRGRRKDGSEFAVDVTLARLPDTDYSVGSVCAAVRDITERKLAESVLDNTRKRLHSVLQTIPDLVWMKDAEGVYLSCNHAFEDLYGASEAEIIGKTDHDFVEADLADFFRQKDMDAIRAAATRVNEEWVTFASDGQSRLLETRKVPVFAADGKVIGVLGVARDITERKQAELQLQQAQEFTESVINTMTDPVCVKDREHRWILFNDAFCSMLGQPREELLGKSDFDFLPEEIARGYWEADELVFTTGQEDSREEKIVNGQGEVRWLYTKKARHVDLHGDMFVVVKILDITERKQMEEELALREREYRTLLENTPDVVVRYDRECRRIYVNSAWEQVNGLTRMESLGKAPRELSTRIKHMVDELEGMLCGVIESGLPSEIEISWIDEFGAEICYMMSATPEFDNDGVVVSVLTMSRDITQRKLMERLLAAREQEARTLLENTPDTIARYDRECRRVYANAALESMVEGGLSALLGKTPAECPGGGNSQIYEEKLREVVASGQSTEFELSWPSSDGHEMYTLVSLTPEFDEAGQVATVLAVGRDITELNAFRDKIHQMAFYDTLTSLPNRALFNDRLRQMITDAEWHGQTAGVMMIDMDRFKEVNDTMGHAVGDELLCETGARLSACVRAYDTVARLGGDEFAILLPDIRNGDDLGSVADKLLEKFKEPFLLEGKEVFISCSIGIALYPDDSLNADDLLKFADSAMYYAKRSGRNNFRFYSGDLTESANERLTLESELRRAAERGELELHYQPKVNLNDGNMIGSEALLRWNHPQRGSVSPVKFIPVAEDSGLIVELGEWVLREACRMACEMNGAGRPLHKIAINLSARQFQSNDLVRTVSEVLDETGCYPEWIELEITESLLMDEAGEVLETLNAFRALGISIAIDDFGTGYSSLSYLARFPINTLKIDRSFINTVTTDHFRAELVKAILSIAKCLGQQVVAEGVETAEQAEFLQAHGCQIAQGYLFSKPQPRTAFLALPGRFDLEQV